MTVCTWKAWSQYVCGQWQVAGGGVSHISCQPISFSAQLMLCFGQACSVSFAVCTQSIDSA